MPRRRGRPGLVGTMARTAVVAGTATAVHGAMTGGGKQEAEAAQQAAAQQQQAAYESQIQMAEMQGQLDAMAAQQAPQAAPAGGADITTQLQNLAQLKASGILSEEEFTAAKAKLLAG